MPPRQKQEIRLKRGGYSNGIFGKTPRQRQFARAQEVMINLELLADAEAQISGFYRLCAGAMPEEKDLWNHLADEDWSTRTLS